MRSALVLALLVSVPVVAATFTVNATDDRIDADPSDGACDADLATAGEQCTLRAALQQANVNADLDAIMLPAGTYRLTRRGGDEDEAATGDLDITSSVVITGAGAKTTIVDGRKARDRVFEIRGDATLSAITVQRGRAAPGSTGGGGIRTTGR